MPESINPLTSFSANAFETLTLPVYDRLTKVEFFPYRISPSLAESWEISKDGLKYVFKLRENVYFHETEQFKPTRPLNTNDVLFTFMRQINNAHPYHQTETGSYIDFFRQAMDKKIDRIKKIDDYTIEFTLKKPDSRFLTDLSHHFGSIQSAELAEKLYNIKKAKDFDVTPIGTGPFIFEKTVKNKAIIYKSNKNYWNGAPIIDQLIILSVPDPNMRRKKLLAGDCHLISSPTFEDLKKFKIYPHTEILKTKSASLGLMIINTRKSPFNYPEVREALHLAINKEKIADEIFEKKFNAINWAILPLFNVNNKTNDFYDIKKAKSLLNKAGFEEGFKTTLWISTPAPPGIPKSEKIAEYILKDWSKVGVDLQIIKINEKEYLPHLLEKTYDTALVSIPGQTNPDSYISPYLTCNAIIEGYNLSQWCDENHDQVINTSLKELELTKRQKEYQKINDIIFKESPVIPLINKNYFTAYQKNIKKIMVSPLGYHDFHRIDIGY